MEQRYDDGILLQTYRLLMRPLQMTDLDAHYAVIDSDPEVTWLGVARTREESEQYLSAKVSLWSQYGFGPCAVIENSTGVFLGHGGLEPLEETNEIQLSYYLGRPAWGRGFATELGQAALEYGMNELNLQRIAAIVRPRNKASQRVLTKLGFVHERDGIFSTVEAQYWVRLSDHLHSANETS